MGVAGSISTPRNRHGQWIFGDGYEQRGFVLELRGLRLHQRLLIGGELRLAVITSSGAMVPISSCFLLFS